MVTYFLERIVIIESPRNTWKKHVGFQDKLNIIVYGVLRGTLVICEQTYYACSRDGLLQSTDTENTVFRY